MTPNQSDVASLADRLSQSGDTSLSDADRQLVVSALRELATSQDLITRQSLLLASFDADAASIERDCRQALSAIDARLTTPPASAGYDFAAAAAARSELGQRIRDAGSLAQVLTAALTFAARFVG